MKSIHHPPVATLTARLMRPHVLFALEGPVRSILCVSSSTPSTISAGISGSSAGMTMACSNAGRREGPFVAAISSETTEAASFAASTSCMYASLLTPISATSCTTACNRS